MSYMHDCIFEAKQNNWLDEVEGLKISLAAAEAKLATLTDDQKAAAGPVLLHLQPFSKQAPRRPR